MLSRLRRSPHPRMASARKVAMHVDEIVDDSELEALMGQLAIDVGKPFRRETGKSVSGVR